MKKYSPEAIEKKWQKYWEQHKTFEVSEVAAQQKFYALIEFPYPSGAGLHVGHPRPFTAMDVVSRKKRMEGFNVLYPIGFDAFGLPTENYAIKTGRPPAEVTAENIATFTRQLKSLGFGFDWSRVIDTTDPKYYKWTQWLFLQFFKAGLAYKKNQPINWCPKDKIGLANEEVVNGCCERCGTPVEARNKEQWMLAITKYAEKLLQGLEEVQYIPEAKAQQQNWIGKSEGAEIEFGIKNQESRIKVFTTRPDTLFGVTFLAISAELGKKWVEDGLIGDKEIERYSDSVIAARTTTNTREEPEKTGVFSGVEAINPATGETIPVWITNYVLGTVGTGAVMGVPAHDERDFDFAKKYTLPLKQVVAPLFVETANPPLSGKKTVRRKTVHAIVSRKSDGAILMLSWKGAVWGSRFPHTFIIGGVEEGEEVVEAAAREIIEETGYKSLRFVRSLGVEFHTTYYAAHKDENRYAEIHPLYFELDDEAKNAVEAVESDKHDPVWIPRTEVGTFVNVVDGPFEWRWFSSGGMALPDDGILINSGEFSGLTSKEARKKITEKFGVAKTNYKLRDWVFSRQRYWGEPIPIIICDKCGYVPVPEDQLPLTLPKVDKYEPTDTGESPLSKITDWVTTTCPKCTGPAKRETDTMPNWAGSSWYWLRYMDPHNDSAFAAPEKLKYWAPVDWYNGGNEHTVLHLLYSRFWNQFLFDQGLVPTLEPYKKRTSHGIILAEDGEKMSKSRGNVVNPDEIVAEFGADALRTYIMFMGPFDQAVAWNTNGVVGVYRFLEKVWNLQEKITADESALSEEQYKLVQPTITTIRSTVMYVTLDTLSLLESNPFHVIRAKENDVFDCGVENGFCKTDIHDTLIKRILIGKHSLEL
jgi:leucyl-tRNA synthetase